MTKLDKDGFIFSVAIPYKDSIDQTKEIALKAYAEKA